MADYNDVLADIAKEKKAKDERAYKEVLAEMGSTSENNSLFDTIKNAFTPDLQGRFDHAMANKEPVTGFPKDSDVIGAAAKVIPGAVAFLPAVIKGTNDFIDVVTGLDKREDAIQKGKSAALIEARKTGKLQAPRKMEEAAVQREIGLLSKQPKEAWAQKSKRAYDAGMASIAKVMEEATTSPFNAVLHLQNRIGLLSDKDYQKKFDLLHNTPPEKGGGVDNVFPAGSQIASNVGTLIEATLGPVHAVRDYVHKYDPASAFVIGTLGEILTFHAMHSATGEVGGGNWKEAKHTYGERWKESFNKEGVNKVKIKPAIVREVMAAAKEAGIDLLPEELTKGTPEAIYAKLTAIGNDAMAKAKAQAEKKAAKVTATPGAPGALLTPEQAGPGKLPQSLRSSKPRFIDRSIDFADDVQKALYIVASDAKGASKSAPKFKEWLRSQGFKDAEIAKAGAAVKELVRRSADANPEGNVKMLGAEPVKAPVVAETPALSADMTPKETKVTKPKVAKAPVEEKPAGFEFVTSEHDAIVDKSYPTHRDIIKQVADEHGYTGKVKLVTEMPKGEAPADVKYVSPRLIKRRAQALAKEKGISYEQALKAKYIEEFASPAKNRKQALKKSKATLKQSREPVLDIVDKQTGRKHMLRLSRHFGAKEMGRILRNSKTKFVSERKGKAIMESRGFLPEEMEGVRAFHDTLTGNNYLMVEKLNEFNVAREFLHEVGGHAARLGFKEKAFQRILGELRKAEAGTPLGKAVERAKARVPQDTPPKYYWEEVAMRLIDEPGHHTIKQRITNHIKGMFRKLGFNVGKLTQADIQMFAERAVKQMASVKFHNLDAVTLIETAVDNKEALKMAKEIDPVEATLIEADTAVKDAKAELAKMFKEKDLTHIPDLYKENRPETVKQFDAESTKLLHDVMSKAMMEGIDFETIAKRSGMPEGDVAAFVKASEMFSKALVDQIRKDNGKQINPIWKGSNKQNGIANTPIYEKWHGELLKLTKELFHDKLFSSMETPETTFAPKRVGDVIHELFRGRPAEAAFNFATEHQIAAKQNKLLYNWLSSAERAQLNLHMLTEQPRAAKYMETHGIAEVTRADLTPKTLAVVDFFREQYDRLYHRMAMMDRMNGRKPMEYESNYASFIYDYNHMQEQGLITAKTSGAALQKARAKHIEYGWQETRTNFLNKYGAKVKLELDAFKIFEKYQKQALRSIHYTPVVEMLHNLINHSFELPVFDVSSGEYVNKKINYAAYNHAGWKIMNEYINDMARGHVRKIGEDKGSLDVVHTKDFKALNTIIREINENAALSFLTGGRFTVVQFGSLIPTMTLVGKHLPKAILSEMSAEGRAFLDKHSRHIKTRSMDSHADMVANSALYAETGYQKLKAKAKWVSNKGAYFANLIDYTNARLSWHAYYLDGIEQGVKRPARYADSMVIRTQSSGMLQDRAPIQRSLAGQSFTPFQSYGITIYNLIRSEMIERGGISETGRMASNALSISKPHLTITEHKKALAKMADEMGFDPKNLTKAQAFKMAAVFTAVTFASNIAYKAVDLNPPDPDVVGSVYDAYVQNEDEDAANIFYEMTKAGGQSALGYFPPLSGSRYGRGVLGGTVEIISNLTGPDSEKEFFRTLSMVTPGYQGLVKPVVKAAERDEEDLQWYFLIPHSVQTKKAP